VRQRTAQIKAKNKELEQFAYVASHDLQEPSPDHFRICRAAAATVQGQTDENADKFLDYMLHASERMKVLI